MCRGQRLEVAEGLVGGPLERKTDQLVLVAEVVREHSAAESAGAGNRTNRGVVDADVTNDSQRDICNVLATTVVINYLRNGSCSRATPACDGAWYLIGQRKCVATRPHAYAASWCSFGFSPRRAAAADAVTA